jgi:hypothetical protein
MNQTTKQAILAFLILMVGFGIGHETQKTVVVEKKIEIPVEKRVEVESPQCAKDKHNLGICAQMLDVATQSGLITSDILSHIDYYIAYPDEVTEKVNSIDALAVKMDTLKEQVK